MAEWAGVGPTTTTCVTLARNNRTGTLVLNHARAPRPHSHNATQRRTTRRSPISWCRSQQRSCTSNKTARAHTLQHLQRVYLGHVVPGLIERQIRPVLGPLQLCSQRPTALRLLRLPPRVAIHQCESHTSSNAQQLREGRCHEKETKWVVTGRSDCSTFNRQTTNQAPATSQKP